MPLPCASKRALRRSPGTPREQLARLSLTPGRGSKLQAIPWIRNQASLSSQREGPRRSLPGQLRRSTWDVHHIIYYSMDCAKHCPYRVLAECSQPPWEGQWGRVVLS